MAAKKKKKGVGPSGRVAAGFSWTKSNRACVRVYATLIDRQFSVEISFADAGKLQLSALNYYVRGSGSVTTRAESLALWLGNYFMTVRGAKMESGVSQGDAFRKMSDMLIEATKTLADFTELVDGQFRFRREEN